MELETWLMFVAAVAALLAIPGPVVVLLLSQVLAHGRGVALGAVAGVLAGDLAAMIASLAGAGAILAASATLFAALKLFGAVYLVWLGIGLWRRGFGPLGEAGSEAGSEAAAARRGPSRAQVRLRAFRQAFAVTALNPKDILFFVAFLPQFVDQARPAAGQIAIIVATFLVMTAISASLWVAFAARMRGVMAGGSARRIVARTGAGALIGAGAYAAFAG